MEFFRENVSKIFTTIVVLIIVIVFVIACSGNKLSNSNTYEGLEQKLKEAAISYAQDNRSILPKKLGESKRINLDTLINAKKIKQLYSVENKNVSCEGYVNVVKKEVDEEEKYIFNPYIKCGKLYTTKTISEYIIDNDKKTNTGEGLYKVGNTYIFKGEEPNNYIMLSDTLYRIIKITEENELKLIKYEALDGSYSWDNRYNKETDRYYGINDYSKSRIKESLEEIYDDDTLFNEFDKSIIVAKDLCTGKRAEDNINISFDECATKQEAQKIGLIQISDIYAASLDLDCKTTEDKSCDNYNYLSDMGKLVTPTASSNSTYEIYIYNGGILDLEYASYNFVIRPVIYIDKTVLYKSGDGSYENPYIVR